MNLFNRNLVAAVWAFILGEVLAYITGQLETMKPDYLTVGIVSVVMALIAVNAINAITGSANPAKDEASNK